MTCATEVNQTEDSAEAPKTSRLPSARAALGRQRSLAFRSVAVAVVLLASGTLVAAALGRVDVAILGMTILLAGAAGLMLLVLRRVGVLLRTVRDHDRRVARELETVEAMASVNRQALVGLLGPEGRLSVVERRLMEELGVLREVTSGVPQTVATRSDEMMKATERATLSILQRTDGLFRQAEASLWLHRRLSPRQPLPYSRGWAASPDFLRTIVETVLEVRPGLVVECGSGLSTLWMGYALQDVGRGRCVALEHDPNYAEQTDRELERHGLTGIVEVRHAPLTTVELDGVGRPWYEPTSIQDLAGIGVLVVDGPPGTTGPRARYPALPLLRSRLAPGSVIILDDTARVDDREVSDLWVAADPTISRQVLPHEKGCHILRLP